MFSKAEADRILKRAAEIEGTEDTRPLTLGELRSIANEAGFGTQAVERAIAEAKQLARQGHPPQPVHRTGFVVTRLSTSRTVPVELSSRSLTQAIRLFQPYRDGDVRITLEEDRLMWLDGKGLTFTVWSAGGVTELHVFVSKLLVRRGRWREWVQTAADRLEAVVLMVAAQGGSTPPRS
jgi:hypothetical protein